MLNLKSVGGGIGHTVGGLLGTACSRRGCAACGWRGPESSRLRQGRLRCDTHATFPTMQGHLRGGAGLWQGGGRAVQLPEELTCGGSQRVTCCCTHPRARRKHRGRRDSCRLNRRARPSAMRWPAAIAPPRSGAPSATARPAAARHLATARSRGERRRHCLVQCCGPRIACGPCGPP